MHILLITRQFPYPERDGESIAIQMMAQALVDAGVVVDLFAINTSKHPFDDSVDIPELSHYRSIYRVAVANEISPLRAITSLWDEVPYYVSRYYSQEVVDRLREVVSSKTYDVVQLEGLQTIQYAAVVREHCDAQVIYRPHNIEHRIWSRMISEPQTPWHDRWYYRSASRGLAQYEATAATHVDKVITMTEIDARWWGQHCDQVEIVPIAVERTWQGDHRGRKVGFLGSLDWAPNLNGLQWYIENVHQQLIQLHPDYRLVLAGRKSDTVTQLRNLDGVELLGEIDDVADFWSQVGLLIVPLMSGSGMRVKIIEAMQNEVPVLTTTVGVEGIPAIHGEHALISDDSEDWRVIVSDFVSNNGARHSSISQAAQLLAQERYSGSSVASQLLRIYAAT